MSVTHAVPLKRSENWGTAQNWWVDAILRKCPGSYYSVVGVERHQRKQFTSWDEVMYELQRWPVKVVKEIKQNAPPILTTFTRRIREGVNSEHLHREIDLCSRKEEWGSQGSWRGKCPSLKKFPDILSDDFYYISLDAKKTGKCNILFSYFVALVKIRFP